VYTLFLLGETRFALLCCKFTQVIKYQILSEPAVL